MLYLEPDAFEHHDGGPSLRWMAAEGDPNDVVIRALRVLAPVIVPLSVEATRHCYAFQPDAEVLLQAGPYTEHVDHTGFRLVSADAPACFRQWYVGDHETRVARLDEAALLDWLRSLRASCPIDDQHAVEWGELLITSARVRVPHPELGRREEIAVRAAERPGSVIAVPIQWSESDGEAWAVTPSESMNQNIVRPPLELRFRFDYGGVEVVLDRNWSSWTQAEPGQRALSAIDRGMKRSGFEAADTSE